MTTAMRVAVELIRNSDDGRDGVASAPPVMGFMLSEFSGD
jgi:hypothetical protein